MSCIGNYSMSSAPLKMCLKCLAHSEGAGSNLVSFVCSGPAEQASAIIRDASTLSCELLFAGHFHARLRDVRTALQSCSALLKQPHEFRMRLCPARASPGLAKILIKIAVFSL